MTIDTWLVFITASLILTMTPGPSILLGVVHSVKYGPRKTIFTALGDISANLIQMIIVATGLGVIVSSSEMTFVAIKWFGVITLLYMGVKMLFSSQRIDSSTSLPSLNSISAQKLYLSGFFVAMGNPKAIVFFTAFFPQFIDTTKPLLPQMMVMCPTMVVLDFIWVMTYAVTANKFLYFMHKCPSCLNRLGGIILFSAAVIIAINSHSPI
ncbi:LysE family translocator [Grimontia sp. NTOU-MAR1]|uniref:LysE family translocator n=1 Tax=Grimontia sp. NTOU-MAR1 TaxID=3111011 RepID=UPI002DB7E6CE|nr:LysE family translocator [Grimontia sp. NTOU-MAR1]WRV99928.1 LysE family translocator [Grimontia sp. NTOU-MAR1]